MNRLLYSLNVVALVTLATFHFMSDGNPQSAQFNVQPLPHMTQQAPHLASQTAPPASSAMLANDSEIATNGTTQRWVF